MKCPPVRPLVSKAEGGMKRHFKKQKAESRKQK